jgi:hypothetical protein
MRSMTDEGPREVPTKPRRPSSDPCYARATFSRGREKGAPVPVEIGAQHPTFFARPHQNYRGNISRFAPRHKSLKLPGANSPKCGSTL